MLFSPAEVSELSLDDSGICYVGMSCEVGAQGVCVRSDKAIRLPKQRGRPEMYVVRPCVSGMLLIHGKGLLDMALQSHLPVLGGG